MPCDRVGTNSSSIRWGVVGLTLGPSPQLSIFPVVACRVSSPNLRRVINSENCCHIITIAHLSKINDGHTAAHIHSSKSEVPQKLSSLPDQSHHSDLCIGQCWAPACFVAAHAKAIICAFATVPPTWSEVFHQDIYIVGQPFHYFPALLRTHVNGHTPPVSALHCNASGDPWGSGIDKRLKFLFRELA